MTNLGNCADLDIICGNHDLVVNQQNRLNSIKPIVEIIDTKHKTTLYERSELVKVSNSVVYGIFSLTDVANYPINFKREDDKTYIALFHGPINNSKTDTGFTMNSTSDLSLFKNYDYAFLGDIHKQQFLRYDKEGHPNIGFSGATLQNNQGESRDKGYLAWNIVEKTCKFVKLQNDYGFHTYHIDKDNIENIYEYDFKDISKNPYIRLILHSECNATKVKEIENHIKLQFNPLSLSIEQEFDSSSSKKNNLISYNITNINNQQDLIKEYLKDQDATAVQQVLKLHSDYYSAIDIHTKNYGKILKIEELNFSNTFSYGADNSVNFNNLNGLVGMFSPNMQGKSSMLSSLLCGLFNQSDRTSKGNLADVINKRLDDADIEVKFILDSKKYLIKRNYKKIENKARSRVSLFEIKDGKIIDIGGESNSSEIEKIIRDLIGGFQEHRMTTFGLQNDLTCFIDESQSARKILLSKFIGIDIIEELYATVKDNTNNLKSILSHYKNNDYLALEQNLIKEEVDLSDIIDKSSDLKETIDQEKNRTVSSIDNLKHQLKNIDSINIDNIELGLKLVAEKIDSITNNKKNINKSIVFLNESIEEFSKLIEEDRDFLIKQNKLLDKLRKYLKEQESKRTSTIKDLEINQKYAKNLNAHDWFKTSELCKKCNFLKDAFESDSKISSIQISKTDIETNIEDVSSKIDEFTEYEDKLKLLDKVASKIEYAKSDLKHKETELKKEEQILEYEKNIKLQLEDKAKVYEINKDIIQLNNEIHANIEENELNLNNLESKIKNLNQFITEKNIELGSVKQKIKDVRESVEKVREIENSFKIHSMLTSTLSKDGIQLEIIKSAIPSINEEIKKVLATTVDFNIYLEIDDSQSIFIYIENSEGDKRNIEIGSGMERIVASIAIRTALSKVSVLPKSDIFFLDEAFSSLDTEHLSNLSSLLDHLKSIFKTVICISHITELQDSMDHFIHVERNKEGFSEVRIE